MTYKKKLIEITITTVDGNTVTVTDTAEDQKASLALAEIKSGRFVKVENTLIATSAIVKVEITQLEDAEVERNDPYGCDKAEETYTVTFVNCNVFDPMPDPIVVSAGESIVLPSLSFGSWCTDCNIIHAIGTSGDLYTPVSDITLYAVQQEV